MSRHVVPGDEKAAPESRSLRLVAASSVGNFVEWFDFTLYGFSASVIAATFFPPGHASGALLATFAIYGVAFVARPAGAVLFGRIGDRRGRRVALSASVGLMGVATLAVGLLPGWATIGAAAPALLLVCRLAQGVSAGGEYAGALAFGAEHAPTRRRALWLGVIGSSTLLSAAAATATVVAVRAISGDAYASSGWRWPFIIGGLLSVVAVFLRLGVAETPAFEEAKPPAGESARQSWQRVWRHWRTMLTLFSFFALLGVVTHMFLGYMPTYLEAAAGLSSSTALIVIMAITVAAALFSPVLGALADRVGRRPILRIGAVGAVVATVPAYLLMRTENMAAIVAGLAALLLVVGLLSGAGATAMLELLPTEVRVTATALPYNVAYAVFGGTAPLVSQAAIDWTGSPLAPAWYATALAVLALPVLLLGIPETRGADLRTGALGSPPPGPAPTPTAARSPHEGAREGARE